MRFLHLADVHLGCRRYNLDERTKDFYRAWEAMLRKHAVEANVDFVLIAGDFFNSRKVDPQAMNHAMAGLKMLKDAGIPVIAIEGNHDQRDTVSDFSWLRSLSQWGYLKLLEPAQDDEGRLALVPWDEQARTGSYIDVASARIFGSHWYGASANAAIPLLADAIRQVKSANRFNILMLHTDVEGQLNRPVPALTIAKLKELKQLVNYVAIGHTHKRFDLDNWAFNPGSLEAVSIDEYREDRGGYLVEVERRGDDYDVNATHIRDYVQRPFQRLYFDVSGAEDADAVHAGVMDVIEREARKHAAESSAPAPIIEINLKGQLGFKNSLLELKKMRDDAQARTNALHVIMRNQSVPIEYAVAAGLDVDVPRAERERRIVEDLIARDVRFRQRAGDMAALVIEAKRLALSSEAPDKILDLIAQKIEERAAVNAATQVDESNDALAAAAPDATPLALGAIERNALTIVTGDK